MKKNKIIYLNGLIDLAQSRLGTKIVYKTDEFFAPAKRIISPWPPVYKEGVFDKNGKWMDGWETRRKRVKGNDFLILKLGKPGQVKIIDVDTSFFSGNHPNKFSLQGCVSNNLIPNKSTKWINLVNKISAKANSHHFFKVKNKKYFTHIKLNIFPDGGVARLRIYGKMKIKIKKEKKLQNLTSILNGSVPIACNNEHFGRSENILAPGIAKNMGDGWETRRSRGKSFDWIIVKCSCVGKIKKMQIDTHHFKGNYPDKCSIQAQYIDSKVSNKQIVLKSKHWPIMLKKTKLYGHRKHNFKNKRLKNKKINYLRINIFPDGGISRIRFFGTPI